MPEDAAGEGAPAPEEGHLEQEEWGDRSPAAEEPALDTPEALETLANDAAKLANNAEFEELQWEIHQREERKVQLEKQAEVMGKVLKVEEWNIKKAQDRLTEEREHYET